MCIGFGRSLEDEKKNYVTKRNILKIYGVYCGGNEEKCENLYLINKVQNIIQFFGT